MKSEKQKLLKKKSSHMKKALVVSAVLFGTSAFATTTTVSNDSFGDLLKVFTDWITGSLGKLLALIGFIATFLIYLMTHKGNVLFIGVIISLIAGGIPGIVETFFDMGANTFETHTTAP